MVSKELIAEVNPEAILYDGLDAAIVGMASRLTMEPVVAYDMDKIIEILMKRDGMDYEEALEYFDYNIIGGWLGIGTPIIIQNLT